jgi:putative membrane protein
MIKNFIRAIVSTGLALILTPFIVTAFQIDNSVATVLIASVVLVLVNFFIKPVVTLVSFPINFITLGFFSLVISALMLFLTAYLVGGITIANTGILTINYFGINLPTLGINSWYANIMAAAVVISTINWILRKIIL